MSNSGKIIFPILAIIAFFVAIFIFWNLTRTYKNEDLPRDRIENTGLREPQEIPPKEFNNNPNAKM